jgi:hypothetical protein
MCFRRVLHPDPDVKSVSQFNSFNREWDSREPVTVWDFSDFAPDEARGYDRSKKVYWENKQMLRFVLGVFAFTGTDDEQVREVFSPGGYEAIHLAIVMGCRGGYLCTVLHEVSAALHNTAFEVPSFVGSL